MTAVAETGVEAAFAELLAEVVGVAHVPVDSNFFEDLGADSLLMASFCALARKRGLPSVSMREVYANPTVASLAAAIAVRAPVTAPKRAAAESEAPTPTSTREFILCGALQALFYLAYTWAGVAAAVEGFQWIVTGASAAAIYLQLVLFSAAAFLVACAMPIAAKWLLIGRWTARTIRIWSLDYLRFWIVKSLIRSNPCAYLMVGSPLYGLYLRALGAKVGPRVVILSRRLPICTDLISIGAGTVIRNDVLFNGYRAHGGRIETGPVTIGRDACVSDMSILEIRTSMGDGAQLGHASALLSGQSVPAGERWHGSPAVPTDVDYLRVPPAPCGPLRRGRYAVFTLAAILFVHLPLLLTGAELLFTAITSPTRGLVVEALVFSAVFFLGYILVGLLAAGILPRLLNRFIEPGRVYPLYGFRYGVHRAIAKLGQVEFLPLLFGDSSYIVHYLGWLGCRLHPIEQTGSNFGSEVRTSNPPLTSFGIGTMVADGLGVINDQVSSTSFRVLPVAIGRRNFIGNDVTYPAGGATGSNVLLATKVMVPIDGPVRRGVGLLGSPPFEVPRSVERDSRFDHLREGDAMRRALKAKDRFNLWTIVLFLLTRWGGLFMVALIDLVAFQFFYGVWGHGVMAALFTLSAVAAALYYALVERGIEALSPPPPAICSIYDPAFWWVERVWKLHPFHLFHLFNGTPFKGAIWRLIGVRIGARVFDDGVYISEPLLTSIGDECVFNERSKIQCESQEDGTYKSGPTSLGSRCTLGVSAFVHYGVAMGDGAVLEADSFLMKGEHVPARARWAGNPAREA
jgi:non-ribosomal peptide synthetase-like protein